MASGLHEEEIEMEAYYGNIALSSSRSPTEARGVTPAVPGRKLLRVVAVSFGLLCVLQAALNICLRFTLSHQREENQQIHNSTMLQLQEIKSRELMRERDQLQTSNNNLTRERDQLQTSNNYLTSERDQLQTNYNTLTRKRDQLQTSNNNLTIERDQLQTSNNNLTRERDQLQTSNNNLTRERDQLQTSNNNLTRERDQLQTSNNNLTRERDQLQTSNNNLTSERDQLQTNYNTLTRKRDQLQTSNNNLTSERDQLQTSNNNLTSERDQLQTSHNNLTRERDQLQTLINSLSQITVLGCPSGWEKFQSSCYYISDYRTNWEESRQRCLLLGANLVIINSRGEQAFLKGFHERFWIGLSDLDNEGQWRWVDGTGLTDGIWAPGEPNDIEGEDCVELIRVFNAWNDGNCSNKNHSVCEKLEMEVKVQFTAHQAASSSLSIEMVSVLHEEEIEMEADYGNIPQSSSRSPAGARGVTPAVPGRKLLRVVAVSFGLLCVLQAALNICLRFTLSHQREENQQIHNSTMLQLQEIKSHDLMRERDQLQTSYNNLTRTRDQLQTRMNNLMRERNQFQECCLLGCPLGWHKFQSSCYYVSKSKKNWKESRQECLRSGANLVIINSRAEQAFLKGLHDLFWIGLSDLDNEGQWRWVDGTGLTDGIWAPEEPNDEYGGEDCVELLQKFNAWNDASCSAMKHSVCEKLVST
ncbi:uncharacterized protein LOC143016665 [Genypterus blacodes]|uniref:uncharacterized protein LOC143016665 n=1 Tax=Genypterus blacodes TaxID=154954 RepID=UPI003F7628C1